MTDIQRRTLLKLGTGAVAVAATSVGFNAVNKNGSANTAEPFFGKHQSGIATQQQEHATWASFKVNKQTNRDALGRLMRVWTTDAARLMAGQPALADNEETLAVGNSNLTITFGFGPELLKSLGQNLIDELPEFSIDNLQSQWNGGDLLIQVCANDQVKVHHALRELTIDALPFAQLKWRQSGFLPSGDLAAKQTPRNLMGQKDGTMNFKTDTAEFDRTVWINEGPAIGGTTLVIRRIQMHLDSWEKLSPDLKGKVIGRDLTHGAPLTGGDEFAPGDFEKSDHHGLVIPGDAHIRRARTAEFKIHRRGYNYQSDSTATGVVDHGLIFATFQADLRQFIEIQKRLASMDSLNTWTTPIGSAVFLIPPGCDDGGWIGQTLI
jgi:dye decolorizing peroxidase